MRKQHCLEPQHNVLFPGLILILCAHGPVCAQPQMVRELGAVVRNQVPAARPSVLSAYGEVLLRAARDAGGACVYEVEALVQVGRGSRSGFLGSGVLALVQVGPGSGSGFRVKGVSTWRHMQVGLCSASQTLREGLGRRLLAGQSLLFLRLRMAGC